MLKCLNERRLVIFIFRYYLFFKIRIRKKKEDVSFVVFSKSGDILRRVVSKQIGGDSLANV